MKIIDTILQSAYFAKRPPVLIDIGASGEINRKWKRIARYAICVAFDADDREFHIRAEEETNYLKLLVFNRIVTSEPVETAPFFLTSSPFCSSLLEPDIQKLEPWLFKPLFALTKVVNLPAVTLGQSLEMAGLTYIDWFKTDTQGTDLRIFTSLTEELKADILAAEFEPGIMDAYKGEDKFDAVIKEMDRQGFWLSSMQVKGTQRLRSDYLPAFGRYASERIIKISPCWAELSFFKAPEKLGNRSLLLLYVFALLEKQFGFALELADYGLQVSQESIFTAAKVAATDIIRKQKRKLPLIILHRKINKLFANLYG